ncbi:hypothetical protein [Rhizobium sp. S96]|uniref:hypothetical protein n=1 Tax=Rhizobium sp. S96 TaxID=3055140 RepID=UPI0025AB541A|nr:hypothetical protein [Rhizobium sp. S96]MDM9620597.1 hypothetical protein [Rhizobium sp. S96]
MGISFEGKLAEAGLNERSDEDLDELAALARLISFARYAAQDINLASAVDCLDLALHAVKRELGDVPYEGLSDPIGYAGVSSH